MSSVNIKSVSGRFKQSRPLSSAWAETVAASPTLASKAEAQNLKKQGRPIYDFGIGEMNPEIPVPPVLVDAMVKAIQTGAMHYSPASGDPELVDAISADMELFGLRYSSDQIVVCPGPKDAIFKIFLSLLNPEAERRRVVAFSPIYESYQSGPVVLTGEEPILLDTDDQFFPDPIKLKNLLERDECVSVIVLNSPNNPTGAVYPLELLEKLAEVIVQYPEIAVLSDEVYRTILYDKSVHHSLASLLPEQTLLVGGMSKEVSGTGIRLGYVAGPVALVQTITKLQGNISSCVNLPAQRGYAHFLSQDCSFSQRFSIRDQLKTRRDLLLDSFRTHVSGVNWEAPKGAFYFFPDMRSYLGYQTAENIRLRNDEDLFQYLSREAGVITVPGSRFGRSGHLRFSYAVDPAVICDGIHEMGQALRKLLP